VKTKEAAQAHYNGEGEFVVLLVFVELVVIDLYPESYNISDVDNYIPYQNHDAYHNDERL
jgi:hypothetical protein